MTDFHCPTCKTELMEHEAKDCLARWFYGVTGWGHSTMFTIDLWVDNKEQHWFTDIVHDVSQAYRLMEWLWERDPYVTIHEESISIKDRLNRRFFIDGPTFPLRVCRAALWLALTQSSQA